MQKVLLIDRFNENDQRDITDLADGWYTPDSHPSDVNVVYHHILVNGQRVPDRCVRRHSNSYVKVVEE